MTELLLEAVLYTADKMDVASAVAQLQLLVEMLK
jgi:hypothetical protein